MRQSDVTYFCTERKKGIDLITIGHSSQRKTGHIFNINVILQKNEKSTRYFIYEFKEFIDFYILL